MARRSSQLQQAFTEEPKVVNFHPWYHEISFYFTGILSLSAVPTVPSVDWTASSDAAGR